ncbi:MAG: DNA mismatch repair protein MutS [Firmicutes bacterium]|nr:DNA mismatch repair protein MutS [Bacillota bacterium]
MTKQYTPMMRQYLRIKEQHQDCILFFRLGDFYEMFLDDAEEASRILGIALTGRDAGAAGRVPMCGIPYHSADTYIAKLIVHGKKVAICEQVEDPSQAKGLVERRVVRIITPGSLLDSSMLEDGRPNYLAALHRTGQAYGLALVELSTGEVLVGAYSGRQLPSPLIDDFLRFAPAELVLGPELEANEEVERLSQLAGTNASTVLAATHFAPAEAERVLREQYGEEVDPNLPAVAVQALGASLHYLRHVQQRNLPHLRLPQRLGTGTYMHLDTATCRNLELLRGYRSESTAGSLLAVLDQTTTALGARELKQWITRPLYELDAINRRLDAVAELHQKHLEREQLRQCLQDCYDLERLASRVATGVANARDLQALGSTLRRLPQLLSLLNQFRAPRLQAIASDLMLLPDLADELGRALREDLPLSIREGGIFASGYNQQLDDLRRAAQEGKQWLAQLEARERELTGIKSLKVGFNKVFGYYLEVTKANLDQVPPHYVRKQTLVNAERFITDELKSREDAILGGEEKQRALEYELFVELRERVSTYVPAIQKNARLIAELDCLQSLAEVAVRQHYCRPQIAESGTLEIIGGRHPVVEQVVGRHKFVPNDLSLQAGETLIITGPNMGGKSTYMRQVALIVIMAQMGSFVPAESATIGLVDRIFTRVGAADDLFSGQSTFMVEMVESKVALTEATQHSLILFDELGRGTSTFDGMALAWAIIEYVQHHLRAKTLFSTHYHELTGLAERLPLVRNVSCQVAEDKGELVFLHRVVPGRADRSYGINVAKMAGLPTPVIQRARQVLARIEQRSPSEVGALQLTLGDYQLDRAEAEAAASSSLPTQHQQILDGLAALDINELTPLDALNLLASWSRLYKEGVE